MFCPRCGERNGDISDSCISCGLPLGRIREVLDEFEFTTCQPGSQNISTDRKVFSGESSQIDSGTGKSGPGNVTPATPEDPAGIDILDPVQLKDKGNELFRKEKYLDALDCYEKALAIDQFYKEAWFNKSIVLKKIGRDDQSKVCMGIYKRLNEGPPVEQKNRQM